MSHRREAQKQKLSLKNFHTLARSSLQSSSTHRRLLRPRTLLIGLTATVGISSIAYAASDGAFTAQPIKSPPSSSSPVTSPAATQQAETTVTVESSTPPPAASNPSPPNSNPQVTINNEVIPVENGKVERTFTDSNGATYSVDISVNSSSGMNGSSNSSTDISIDSSSSSTSENSNRGSPHR